MNMIESLILNKIISAVDSRYFESAEMSLRENSEKASYNSIVIQPSPTAYRQTSPSEVLFCRVKTKGNINYISFPSNRKSDIDKLGFEYSNVSSDDFLRIDIDRFLNREPDELFNRVMSDVFLKSFSFPTFGCCSRYKQCSQVGKCIHPDMLYATACMYKQNLDSGKVFYKD